jgi:hypothetical protein
VNLERPGSLFPTHRQRIFEDLGKPSGRHNRYRVSQVDLLAGDILELTKVNGVQNNENVYWLKGIGYALSNSQQCPRVSHGMCVSRYVYLTVVRTAEMIERHRLHLSMNRDASG